jgi:hypothetical protein
MLFKLRLADVDRERFGCAEQLDVDVFSVTAWEAALIQRGFTRDGIRVAFDSPTLWLRALTGEVVTGENGEPVMDPVVGLDGEPTVVPRRRPDLGAEMVMVWLALRHAGIDVPMAEVDYRIGGATWETVTEATAPEEEVPGESEGKDDADSPSERPSPQTSPA